MTQFTQTGMPGAMAACPTCGANAGQGQAFGGQMGMQQQPIGSMGGGVGQMPWQQAGFGGQGGQQAGFGQLPWQGFGGQFPWQQAGFGGQFPWQQTGFGGMTPWQQRMFGGMTSGRQAGFGGQGGQQAGFGGMMPWQGWGAWGPSGWMAPWTMPTLDDEQIRNLVYDAIDADPLVPFDSDITADVTGGVVTLRGTVPNKRVKHAIGDDAWWIPGVIDVNNQLEVRRRERRATPTGQERQPATAQPMGREGQR
ncbi:MAG: BON domain-containing protein [Chloroflexi bacterium]|nr:BON domain-containing protein [Chloroflexota bacterium]